jgi:hypothetical protein
MEPPHVGCYEVQEKENGRVSRRVDSHLNHDAAVNGSVGLASSLSPFESDHLTDWRKHPRPPEPPLKRGF